MHTGNQAGNPREPVCTIGCPGEMVKTLVMELGV